jgi:hypothetical protein
VTAEKEGYLPGETQALDSTSIDVPLKRLKEFNFRVVLNKYHGGVIENDEELEDYMVSYISLQSYDEPSLLMYKQFPFSDDATDEQRTITLMDQNSKYLLDILLIDEVDGQVIGGYNGNWSISYTQMQNNNEIVFHVVEYLPKPIEAMDQYEMFKFLEEDNNYRTTLRPEFVRN